MAKASYSSHNAWVASAKAAYHAPSPALAQALREDLVARFEREAPGTVRCFEEDFDACITHLELPRAHRRVTRTTNLLERLFEEERRRTKVALTLWGERPVLELGFAALLRASEGWRGLRISDLERNQLERLRDRLIQTERQAHAPAVTRAETQPRGVFPARKGLDRQAGEYPFCTRGC